jgi:hypothetical protein
VHPPFHCDRGRKGRWESWFFITADYTFGHSAQDDTTKFIQAAGGTVIGSAVFPFPETHDFSAYLLKAQASDPGADVVASKTLPIGRTAKVTNLETGKSALVKAEDRGRLPKGWLVDLTPATAKKLVLTKKVGVAPVSPSRPQSLTPRSPENRDTSGRAAYSAVADSPAGVRICSASASIVVATVSGNS